ncbi:MULTISPECIES: hyaluronoglucosaminidase [Streptomyces]|uniref:Hyaluronoglucosaminidase n=2 Tax=Streptomyces TaxID=1883 RepID=A0ABU4KFY5_9ACTN|nr:hyaluronoglucosaminidase [Streptomyces roseolus]MDX2296699.1 hyaluronoglucosaminidase [Streptomyces roseolus]
MTSTRRLFLGAFTAGAVTVAAGAGTASAAGQTEQAEGADQSGQAGQADGDVTYPGEVYARNFRTDGGTTSSFRTVSTGTTTKLHALTVHQAGTAGNGVALNVVSDNPEDSAMYLSGTERSRGTLKILHRGHADASDAGAAAISVYLDTDGVTDASGGTAAQGIFVTHSTGPTRGNLITLRNNGVDDFVVKGSGAVGIGVPIGATPRGRVEIAQRSSLIGLLMQANEDANSRLIEIRDRTGTARLRVLNSGALAAHNAMFGVTSGESYGGGDGVIGIRNATTVPTTDPANGGVLYAEGGALKWRGPSGTVTEIGSA